MLNALSLLNDGLFMNVRPHSIYKHNSIITLNDVFSNNYTYYIAFRLHFLLLE